MDIPIYRRRSPAKNWRLLTGTWSTAAEKKLLFDLIYSLFSEEDTSQH